MSAAVLGRYGIDGGPKAVRSVDISSYALCQLAEGYGVSIDYDTLTKEEFVTLIGILQKADINRIRQVRSQRGRSSSYPSHGHGKGKKRC